jgi:hypothetical protein
MYKVGARGAAAVQAPVAPPTPRPTVAARNATTERRATTFDIEFADGPETGVGDIKVAEADGTVFSPQVTANRPVLPRVERELPRVANGAANKPAHGVLITGLRSTGTENAFNPVVTAASIQTAGDTEERAFGTAALPSRFARINTYSDVSSVSSTPRQRLVVVPAHYRTDVTADSSGVGSMEFYDRVTTDVYYAQSEDYRAPYIREVTPSISENTVGVRVRTTDAAGVERVVVLAKFGDAQWRTIELSPATAANTWTASIAIPEPRHDLEFFVQAVDANGNVAISNNKGNNYVVSLTAKSYAAFPWSGGLGAWAMDQSVLIATKAPNTHWGLGFNWLGEDLGGSVELATSARRTDGTIGDVVRFEAEEVTSSAPHCERRAGAPVGRVTCELPVELVEGNPYRVRLWILGTDNGDQAWGAWLIDDVTGSEIPIGWLGFETTRTRIGATGTFVTYDGPAADCSAVDPSDAVLGPPSANPQDVGYEYTLVADLESIGQVGCAVEFTQPAAPQVRVRMNPQPSAAVVP